MPETKPQPEVEVIPVGNIVPQVSSKKRDLATLAEIRNLKPPKVWTIDPIPGSPSGEDFPEPKIPKSNNPGDNYQDLIPEDKITK